MMETISWRTLVEEKTPAAAMRFIKKTGKGINTYSMIRDGDTILLSVSGGKDSLALALALSLRRRWLPIDYTLKAVLINWIEHPIPEAYRSKLSEYFSALDIDFTILDEHQYPDSFGGQFNCYLCSRNRRRILFEYCEREGISVIAMGHHLDDLVETSLMNLCFRANFATMQPVQTFFGGKITIIRPMIEVRESMICNLVARYDLPIVKPVCPFDETNIRSRLKPIIRELSHIDKLTREHIYHAHQFDARM